VSGSSATTALPGHWAAESAHQALTDYPAALPLPLPHIVLYR